MSPVSLVSLVSLVSSKPKEMLYCIGHITHDHIITPALDLHCPGGTAWYFAWGMHALCSSLPVGQSAPPFRIITSVSSDDYPAIDQLRETGIDVRNLPTPTTVYFENRYGADTNERTQCVHSKALPFSLLRLIGTFEPDRSEEPIEDRLSLQSDVFILGSLLADDFPLGVLCFLHERGTVVADVQGYIRLVEGTQVVHTAWPDKREALPYIDILKVNEQEMVALTGLTDPIAAARLIGEWGVAQVLLTLGDQGSYIYTRADGSFVRIPAYRPSPLVDATGCGDTYTMGFLFRRWQGASLYEAGCFAAAVSTLKLQHSGPFAASYDEAMALCNPRQS